MKITQDDNNNIHIVLETEDEKRAMWLQLDVGELHVKRCHKKDLYLMGEVGRLNSVAFSLFDLYDNVFDCYSRRS